MLRVSLKLKNACAWAEAGHEVAFGAFELPALSVAKPLPAEPLPTGVKKLADRADSDVAKAEVREALVNVRAMLDTLGLDPLAEPWVSDGAAGGAAGAGADSAEHDALDKLVSEQLAERAEARKAKDFARADAIRDALGAAGIAIEDGPQGSTWSLK